LQLNIIALYLSGKFIMAAIKFSRFILKITRWKLIGVFPKINKAVIVAAPHTSVMDFVWGWLGINALGVSPKFIIKKEFFFFPLGIILKALGAIPLKRGDRNNDMVAQMVCKFNSEQSFFLIITPEGTRKKTKNWKKGFHLIAKKSNVPVVISTVNYGEKKLGIIDTIYTLSNFETDIIQVKKKYEGIIGKYPECFTNEI